MIIFGYTFIKTTELSAIRGDLESLSRKYQTYLKVADEKDHQISILKKKVDGNKLVGIIDIDIGDPTPEKIEPRKEYVARVAGFYKDIFKAKCVQMISVFHKLLEEETNDRETDNILKVGIFVCRDFMKWGEQAVNEQLSYQIEPPPTAIEKKEAIAA